MKILLTLMAFAIMSVSISSLAKKIYADIQVTDINPTKNLIWERKNKNTPKYPIELARAKVRGCAVLSFDISGSGKAENIEVINSLPKKSIGKYSRKMLRKWKWIPVSTMAESTPEKRTLRLDFCLGGKSIEQSQQFCKQQIQLACG